MRVYPPEPNFVELAKKHGLYIFGGGEDTDGPFDGGNFVKPSDPLIGIILDDPEYFAEEAWVEVPEE